MDHIDTFPEKVCSNCGEAIGKLDGFCKSCGHEIIRPLRIREHDACKNYCPVSSWEGLGPIPCKTCGLPEDVHTHIDTFPVEKEV